MFLLLLAGALQLFLALLFHGGLLSFAGLFLLLLAGALQLLLALLFHGGLLSFACLFLLFLFRRFLRSASSILLRLLLGLHPQCLLFIITIGSRFLSLTFL